MNTQQTQGKTSNQEDQEEVVILTKKIFNEITISVIAIFLIILHLYLPKNTEEYLRLDEEYQHLKNFCIKEARQDIMLEIIKSDINNSEQTLLSLKSKIAPYRKEIKKHNEIADLRDQELNSSKFGNYTNLRSFVFILGISLVFLAVCISNLSKSYKSKSNLISGITYTGLAIFMLIRISLPQDISKWLYLLSFFSIFLLLLYGAILYSKSNKNFKEQLSIALGVIITVKHKYFIELAARLNHKEKTGEDLPNETSLSEEIQSFDDYISENLERVNREV